MTVHPLRRDVHQARADELAYGSVASGARLLRDAWTILIARELLCGATRFNDIHRGLPGLSRSMLSSRLRDLEKAGVLTRRAIGDSAWHEYQLTSLGLQLRPVLVALGEWAETRQQELSSDSGASTVIRNLAHSADLSALPRGKVCIEFEFPESRWWLHLESGHIRTCVDIAEPDVDLIVVTTVDVLDDLWCGVRDCCGTIAAGQIGFRGPESLAHGFRGWFRKSPLSAVD